VDDEARATGAVVLVRGAGRAIDLGNFAMSLKVAGEQTGGAFSLLEANEPPGFGPPVHIHYNCGEAFYVLEGEYHIFIEAEEHRCPAGTFIYIPPGVQHGFRVGARPSRKLNLYSPAAMVGYFEELSASILGGLADPQVLDDIAKRAGMEVIGPVPEGYL
jgi:quercetin dioxygenase-like cupin family protein